MRIKKKKTKTLFRFNKRVKNDLKMQNRDHIYELVSD